MTQEQAKMLAEILNAKVWSPHRGVYRVVIERQDNHIVVIDGESIKDYKNMTAFFENYPKSVISFE